MTRDNRTLTYHQAVGATPAEVYRAFTGSTALREWLCDSATVACRLGGHFFAGWNEGYYATGHYTELDVNRVIGFSWQGRGEPRPTAVRVTLAPGDEGTLLSLEHSGIGSGPEWSGKIEEFDRGWVAALENLASVLTTGEDLRVTRRPMLGILPTVHDPSDAARLGVPVDFGVRLSGVVPDLGAAAAGLRQDDVIVAIDGAEIQDLVGLRSAIQSKRAGDTVAVEYYRGGERLSTPMTLSGRKLPAIPESREELVLRVGRRLTKEEDALEAFLSGVTDVEASYRPGPESWSIKQVLAHLIQSERYNQQWISELVGGDEGAYDGGSGNQEMRLNATIHAFPTLADMMTELKRLNAETLALLEHLPDEFLLRRRTYWRLARTLLDESYSHVDDHLSQMRAASEGSRS